VAVAETRALIISGLGGHPDYEVEFQRHASQLANRLKEVSEDVTLLVGDTADTQTVQLALSELKARLRSDDTLLFAYVGHSSYDGERFKFNVIGSDFSATELGGWLEDSRAENEILIVTGASSGAVQDVLAADNRTLITGTRSGEQKNATVFGRFFTAALDDEAADVDKDKRITALEAFRYAETGIERYYGDAGEMTTENPVTSGPDPVLVLAVLESQLAVDPARNHLYTRRSELEQDIARLRDRKAEYSPDAYFAELQKLLLDMALIENQLDSSADAAPGDAEPATP
jgi:hypothetical protein